MHDIPVSEVSADPARELQERLAARYRVLTRVRPAALSSLLLRLAAPSDRRRIVTTASGLRIYLDPFNHLGQSILEHGRYEADTEQVIREHLSPDATFLDIGANEGYFSALAASLVGANGIVIAVEPQTRLCDIVEINLRLNARAPFRIFNHAIGGEEGERGTINLWPVLNTGASSILHKYRFSSAAQGFAYVTLDRILAETGKAVIDLAKVDVEGFEGHVVEKLLPHIRAGRVARLLLDYHESILRAHGFDPARIHQSLLEAGCDADRADPKHGYVLYTRARVAR